MSHFPTLTPHFAVGKHVVVNWYQSMNDNYDDEDDDNDDDD